MRFKKGDFVKAYYKDKPNNYAIAQVIDVDEETETYVVNELYSNKSLPLGGTMDATLQENETVAFEQITKEMFIAELI